jgi:hypothetical protein
MKKQLIPESHLTAVNIKIDGIIMTREESSLATFRTYLSATGEKTTTQLQIGWLSPRIVI